MLGGEVEGAYAALDAHERQRWSERAAVLKEGACLQDCRIDVANWAPVEPAACEENCLRSTQQACSPPHILRNPHCRSNV
eukprot:6199719-Amphidinium_carterae.1